jgi:hypothetical protein
MMATNTCGPSAAFSVSSKPANLQAGMGSRLRQLRAATPGVITADRFQLRLAKARARELPRVVALHNKIGPAASLPTHLLAGKLMVA